MVEILYSCGSEVSDKKYYCLTGEDFFISSILIEPFKDIIPADDYTTRQAHSGFIHNSGMSLTYKVHSTVHFKISTNTNVEKEFNLCLPLTLVKYSVLNGTTSYYQQIETIKKRSVDHFYFSIFSSSGKNLIFNDSAELYNHLSNKIKEKEEFLKKLQFGENRKRDIDKDFK